MFRRAASLALAVFLLSLVADWNLVAWVAAAAFLSLLVTFACRLAYRKVKGSSRSEAWGREPPDLV
jgi:membrane protein implicated in regulation of membrane protease activity